LIDFAIKRIVLLSLEFPKDEPFLNPLELMKLEQLVE
jgi:hypothetical protein